MILIKSANLVVDLKNEFRKSVLKLKEKNIHPKLAIILANAEASSQIYVKNKLSFCNELGISAELFEFDPVELKLVTLLDKIDQLNRDKHVNGILCQLPLPKKIDANIVASAIDVLKDVDCFNPTNLGQLFNETAQLEPCTPQGIIRLLKYYNISWQGKKVVILNRSKIVGKPLAMMLTRQFHSATVTICHSKTADLKSICAEADILVVAIGKPKIIDSSYIKKGAVVVDVGIGKIEENNRLVTVGDVNFDDVKDKVFAISPVPGGVGPLTVSMLVRNLIISTKLQNGINLD